MSQDTIMLIKDWLLPPGGLVILLVLGLLLWKRALGPLLILLATVSLYMLSIPQTSRWLATPLETSASVDAAGLKARGAQAILVLLAGRTHRAPELAGLDGLSALSLQRLHHAARLHRQSGLPLMVSGGGVDRPGQQEPLAKLAARELADVYQVTPFLLEASSRNTRQNAIRSAGLLAEHGIQRVALVTHAWHMPRARYSAETAGLEVIPAATGFVTGAESAGMAFRDWLPTAKAFWLNRNLLHEYLGLLWYRHGPSDA